MDVKWSKADAEGGFGRVYFGRESESGKNVVVKVPLLWGKPSFDVERHVNSKLRKRGGPNGPWAEYLGSYKLRDIKVRVLLAMGSVRESSAEAGFASV